MDTTMSNGHTLRKTSSYINIVNYNYSNTNQKAKSITRKKSGTKSLILKTIDLMKFYSQATAEYISVKITHSTKDDEQRPNNMQDLYFDEDSATKLFSLEFEISLAKFPKQKISSYTS